jgi:hypothetical protein
MMAHLPQPILHQYPPDLLHLTFNPPSNNMTRLPVMTEVHRNHYFRCPSPINIIVNRESKGLSIKMMCRWQVVEHLWLMLEMPPSSVMYS